MDEDALKIPVGEGSVSALLIRPPHAKALYLFAHGAGVGMTHRAWNRMRRAWPSAASRRCAINFLTWRRARRPDPPRIAHAAVRAAAAEALKRAPDLPLFAGGRSFGGRMTSQAQAASPLQQVRGLAFLGFPLHPAGQPGIERAEHLGRVEIPMLFVSGARDALAERDLLGAGRRETRGARDAPSNPRCGPQPEGAFE